MKKLFLFSIIAFVLASCEKERDCPGAVEKTFTQTGFSRIKAGDIFNVTITKGDAYSIKASGCENDLNDLNISETSGNTIEISFSNFRSKRYNVDFTITTPALNALILSGNAEGTVSGFQNQSNVIRTILSGNAKTTLNGTAINAQVELSGNSVLNLSGQTLSLYGSVSGNSILNAYPVDATEVDILASGNSRAYVTPLEKLFATANGQSAIHYKGNPVQKTIETSGNGRVVKE